MLLANLAQIRCVECMVFCIDLNFSLALAKATSETAILLTLAITWPQVAHSEEDHFMAAAQVHGVVS